MLVMFGVAIYGTRLFGSGGGRIALGVAWPHLIDVLVGGAIGVTLYFATTALQDLINSHLSSWVAWYSPSSPPADLSHGPWIALSVVHLILVPLGEESLFRGFVYQGFRRRFHIAGAATLSAALFAAMHLYPPIMPAIFIDGIVLALAFEWRRTLAMPMVIHCSTLAAFLVHGSM